MCLPNLMFLGAAGTISALLRILMSAAWSYISSQHRGIKYDSESHPAFSMVSDRNTYRKCSKYTEFFSRCDPSIIYFGFSLWLGMFTPLFTSTLCLQILKILLQKNTATKVHLRKFHSFISNKIVTQMYSLHYYF